KSIGLSMPTALIKTSNKYIEFPLYLVGAIGEYYGIAHGFSSRELLLNFLGRMFE
ncbi:DUF2002 family protein, partial [Yersinia pestis]